MKHCPRLDVSLKEISICVVDETGEVRLRGTVACEPEAVTTFYSKKKSGLIGWVTRVVSFRSGCSVP